MAGGQKETFGCYLDRLYGLLLGQYSDPTAEHTVHSLNVLCVRLVFCLYADGNGVFLTASGDRLFRAYLQDLPAGEIRSALATLFHMLNQGEEEREPSPWIGNLMLSVFPYVGRGLACPSAHPARRRL